MKDISIKDFVTERLIIKKPTMDEQLTLWNILRDEKINKYYFPTPNRIFVKNNLKNDDIDDVKKARKIFMDQLNDWDWQKPYYEKKIEAINNEDNSQKFTWSIFLKNGEPIGQITVQPEKDHEDEPAIRDMGWFISLNHQGHGYVKEAAEAVLNFMFNEVEIESIITSVAICNPASWKSVEKLGFKRTGEKESTYYNDNEMLRNYCYYCDKELFNNRNNK